MARRALAKKITRSQARAYRSTTPNPLGVTAIASVNRGSRYQRRYAAARAQVSSSGGRRAAPARRTSTSKGKRMIKNKLSRGQYMRRLTGKKLTAKQKAGLWKGYASRTRQSVKPRGKARSYGKGKFKALRARIGPKRRWTHLYRTRGGSVRHIPEYAELGYTSERDMIKKSSTDKGARIYVARKERLDARRSRSAERTSASILKGKGVFTPNRRRRRPSATYKYAEWEKEMKANARRRKKTTKKRSTKKRTTKKRATAAQTRARLRNLKKARASRKKRSTKKRTTKRRVKRATSKRRTTKRRATKRRTTKKRTTKRRVKRATSKRRTTKRRTTKKRTARRNVRSRALSRRPVRRRIRRRSTRRYLRNEAKAFTKDFGNVLKVGLVVGSGFVVQKVATRFLKNVNLMQKLPGASSFGSSTAGLIVALLGTTLAAKFLPGSAKMVGAGMAGAFLHTVLVEGLTAITGSAPDFLGDYTEASGKAFGSYYEFQPHQTYPAMGEYYSTQMAGMGQYQQAAAGMDQYMQAAAGMGQAPRLSQAAAGTGEYRLVGGKGIGEYEEVVPQYSAPEQVDEGISPDLTSAERALSVAEAAAGVGAYGDERVPLQSMVYPTGHPEAIPDMPGGSRAGTFAGQNGVFGPSH